MAKYLVTGGAGFIGTNLVAQIIREKHQAVVLDNFAGGKYLERIQPEAVYIEGDIRKEQDVKKAMDGVDGVFHLAAIPRMPYSIEHPYETHDVNVNGALQVLLAAKDLGVKKVVYSASSSVYGNQEEFPYRETLKPRPLSPYGVQKFVSEEYCRVFSEVYGLKTVSLRYFNVYGRHLRADGSYASVIAKFLLQKKENRPMTICGDGEYLRDFTHVSDVVRANLLAMASSVAVNGEAVNIGFGHARSINELVNIIGGQSEHVAERKGDSRRSQADNRLAKELFGWEPEVALEEGIKELKKDFGVS